MTQQNRPEDETEQNEVSVAPAELDDLHEPPMDELLAELLAQETDLGSSPAVMAAEAAGSAGETFEAASGLEFSAEAPPAEPVDETVAMPEEAVAALEELAEGSQLVEEPELMLAAGASEVEAVIAEPLAAEVELELELEEPEELEALTVGFTPDAADAPAEAVAVEATAETGRYYLRPFEAEATAEAVADEMEPSGLDALPSAQEQTATPAVPALPPQPGLEELVASIDQALETSPRITPVTEPAAPAVHKQFSQLDDYVVFTLSGSDYAVPVRDVAEIGRIPQITRVPNVPDFMRGITNLRGEVVPVLNLPALLGLQDSAPSARGRVLFLQQRERVSPTGLLVDEVKGIQRIQSQQLEQVTGLVDDKVTSVLRGVHGRGDRLLNVLDLEQLFGLQEFQQLGSR